MEREWIKVKSDRVVAKIRDKDDKFIKSVIVPTEYYPLNGNGFSVFHYENTKQITDEKVLELIDSVPYKIGHCYQNTSDIASILRKNGYDIKTYVGWVFVGLHTFPVHHCWAVLNGNEVIDLMDDFSVMFSADNAQNFANLSLEEAREVLLSFALASKDKKNSVRCGNIGKVSDILFYVGSECSPETGRMVYNDLIRKYPSHECQRNCDSKGWNGTQKLMAENGLMPYVSRNQK